MPLKHQQAHQDTADTAGSTPVPFTAEDWRQIRRIAELMERFIVTSREETAVLKAANDTTNRRIDEALAEIKTAKAEFAKSEGRLLRIIWSSSGFGLAFGFIFWLLELGVKIKNILPAK